MDDLVERIEREIALSQPSPTMQAIAREAAARIPELEAEVSMLRELVARAQIVGGKDLPQSWHDDARAALAQGEG